MKKIFIISLTLIVTVSMILFSGCAAEEKEPEPLRVLVDIDYIKSFDSNIDQDFKSDFLTILAQNGGPKDVEYEYLPREGAEREAALDRLRTEIMSGGGSDIYILACNLKDPISSEKPLFAMPEKAMELALFLPLDEYMENNTQVTEWDAMNQAVLAAGRNEEGQQIVPLCYRIPVAVYSAEDTEHTPSQEYTWMDMLESDDLSFAAAAVWTDNSYGDRAGSPFMLMRAPMTEFILGPIADYEEEELLFTEEELGQRLSEMVQIASDYQTGEYRSAPVHYNTFMGFEFSAPSAARAGSDGKRLDILNGIKYTDSQTLIPLYSDDGGVTAEITAYTAINRNTDRPEDAYRYIDCLMSHTAQKTSHIYTVHLYTTGERGLGANATIPMYDDLMSEEQFVSTSYLGGTDGWHLTKDNFEAFSAVREQITYVKFRNVLDQEIRELYWSYYDAVRAGKNSDAILEEGYRNLQRMVRE